MILSLDKSDLLGYVSSQVSAFFPDKKVYNTADIRKYYDSALERVEYCFSKINSRYYKKDSEVLFNHLNGDHYSMFLYLLSNTLYKNEYDISLCSKLFLLNKMFYGVDAFYEVELPSIFLFVHPLGTVLGRGKYADYFLVYQRCNIGSNKNIYPVMKEFVSLHPGAAVLGNCLIEENCKIGAGAVLMDKNLEKNSLYFGNPNGYVIKKSLERNPIWII